MYQDDFKWASLKIQPLAEKLFYQKIWPYCEIIALDKHKDSLKLILDIGGVDKLIKNPDGTISFLAQRFRRWEQRRYDDFTIRSIRPSGRLTEFQKITKAIKEETLIAAYYSYGLVNKEENGFLRFKIILLPDFIRMLLNQKIKFKGFYWNADRSSGFNYIPFKDLPKKLMYFEYPKRQYL